MKTLKAFFLGMWEFKSDFTTNYDDEGLQWEYDLGRDFAHKLTFRRFE
jgi:hypothetical protein